MQKSILILTLFLFFLSSSLAQNEIKNNQATITTSGGVITLNNFELTNNGTIRDSAATWYIIGNEDTADSEIGGDSLSIINNLTVNKPTGDGVVQLKGNFKVLGDVTLTDGSVNLNQYDIELGSSGWIVSETDANRIFGYTGGTIFKDTTLNAPGAVNPGNMGMQITSTSNLGATRVIRGHNTQYNADSSWTSINRWYDFAPNTNSSLNATLRFHYLGVEITPYFNADLNMWQDPSGVWTKLTVPFTAANRDSSNTWMQMTSFDSLIRITLGPDSIPVLPVDLISFDAEWVNAPDQSKVIWQTATEVNVSHFEVERSYDTYNFHSIGSIEGAGNSNQIINYSFNDNHVSTQKFHGYVYYRLKGIDFDGSYKYSNIIPLAFDEGEGIIVHVYPNPSKDRVFIKVSGPTSKLDVAIRDVLGKKIHEQSFEGLDKIELDFRSFSKGVYFISVVDRVSNHHEVFQIQKIN
jgi:hypothetical protein